MKLVTEIKMKKVVEKVQKLEAQCPYCKNKMISQFEKQLQNNMLVHMENCSENPKNKLEKSKSI